MATIPPGLLLFPIQSPPEGVVATFRREEFKSRLILGIMISSFLVASAVTILRIYTKLRIVKKFGRNDYGFLLAYGLYAGFAGITFKALSAGAWHQWNVYLKDAGFFLYWYRLTGSVYEFTIAVIKVVVAIELMRIFVPRRHGALYWSYIVLIITSCLAGALCGLLEALHCLPIDKQVHPLLLVNPTYGKCFDIDTARIFFSAVLVLQDFALLLLPQYSIWKLQMSKRKKIGISILFGVGIGGCVASSIRLYYTVMVKREKDQLWNLVGLGTCIVIEATCGIIVAACPVLPRLYKHLRDERGWGASFWSSIAHVRSHVLARSKRSAARQSTPPGGMLLQNMQGSADSDETAVSAGEQERNSKYIVKTTEWQVIDEPPLRRPQPILYRTLDPRYDPITRTRSNSDESV